MALAAGVTTFSLTHQYLDDNPSGTPADVYPIHLVVTDALGATATADRTTTVQNVAPTVQLTAPATGGPGQALAFTGSFSDPGSQDTQEVTWDVGDGAGSDFTPQPTPGR